MINSIIFSRGAEGFCRIVQRRPDQKDSKVDPAGQEKGFKYLLSPRLLHKCSNIQVINHWSGVG